MNNILLATPAGNLGLPHPEGTLRFSGTNSFFSQTIMPQNLSEKLKCYSREEVAKVRHMFWSRLT